jgi:dihydrofolate reductase
MKVFLIAAMSADGFIARNHDEHIDWTSTEDKKLFAEVTKAAGVIVFGSTTYKTIGKPLPGRRNIVMSRTPHEAPGIEFTNESPKELVARLSSEGANEVAICGGSAIYSMFLEAGVVDELYLTIEPLLFGTGIKLAASEKMLSLHLLDHRMLNENSLLMHYGVIK